jgi:hypothetical protein
MDKGNGAASAFAAIPDPREWLGSWDELAKQIGSQSTAMSREALAVGLRLFEQSASNTSEYLQTLGQGTRRLGELARATEYRIGTTEDVAGVWNLELGLLGDSAQMAAALGQDTWLALARTQTGLMQSALAQSAQAVEQAVHAANGEVPAPAVPDRSVFPLAAPQWSAWAETAAQGAQAWWNAMAATAAAAAQTPARDEAAPRAAVAPKAKRRARKPVR